ncbi:FAD-dependent thymidylate synthase [Thermocrinis minervae]|uniref:FAD-dependent thymidylate synthase n=1 Tax=Thermocrinis minervae TaxID=381751 RepID=A0A1M6QHD1_9AQUI|nr:FAD-dependent thymidylate synthase [Thermocrinis minervae]SHK19565.1 thymidylate synthase (FAD) [Thermocrinis minervae]
MGSDQRIVRCARVSYSKDDKEVDVNRDKALLKYLYENRHTSVFEHVVIAFEGSKEEWLNLISSVDNPTFQAYYSGGYVWMNLRNLMKAVNFIPQVVLEAVKEKLPTCYALLTNQDIQNTNYTLDSSFVKNRMETSSGWIGLVDSLELDTDMDYYTFVVECPLFVARQWFRHRFGSFNEVSRRYTSYNISFYIPSILRVQSKYNKQASEDEPIENQQEYLSLIEVHLKESLNLYNRLVEVGVAKELARGVLPQFMKTRFYWTVPRISLDNFISLREDRHAQKEIREFALAIKSMVGYKGTEKKASF